MGGAHRILLLFALVTLVAAEAVHTTWLSDWLSQSESKGSKQQRVRLQQTAEVQYGYEEERPRGCLRLIQQKGCSCTGAIDGNNWCSSQVQLHTMGCCRAEDSHINSDMLFGDSQDLSVGTCTWQVTYAQDPDNLIEAKPNVWVRGTASFTCELNAESDKCGSPLCDGMALTGFATIYGVYNTTGPVYTVGLVPPISPADADEPCTESPTIRILPIDINPPQEFVPPNGGNQIGDNGPNTPPNPSVPIPHDPNTGNGNNPGVPVNPTPPNTGDGNNPSNPTPPNTGDGNNPSNPSDPTPPNTGEGNTPNVPSDPTPPNTGEGNNPGLPIGKNPTQPIVIPGLPGKGGKNPGLPITIGPGPGKGGKNPLLPIVIGPGPGKGKNPLLPITIGLPGGGGKNHQFALMPVPSPPGSNGAAGGGTFTLVPINPIQPSQPDKTAPAAGGGENLPTVIPGPPETTVGLKLVQQAEAGVHHHHRKLASTTYERETSGAIYYPAERLNVAVGSFFVTNARHSVRYATGRMQYVIVASQDPHATPVSSPSPNALIFRPFTMDLVFDTRAADTM